MSSARILLVGDDPERLAFYRGTVGDIAEVALRRDTDCVPGDPTQDGALIVLELQGSGALADASVSARRIRRDPHLRATPLLLIGAGRTGTALDPIEGPVDYLPAPVVAAELRARVQLFVDLQSARVQVLHTHERFLSILSHELRTPLNAILGWATLLQTGRVDVATTARALEAIERNARAQTDLIDGMQDVARILAGKVRLDFKQVEPRQIVESAVAAVSAAANGRRIVLSTGLEPGVPPLKADPARLQQVLVELLCNAITVTPEGGQVSVRLAHVPGEVRFTVADGGTGIAPDLMPHLFDRFRRDEGKAGRRGSGKGLGLTLVRRLVELQGGTVGVEHPAAEQGAVFTVRMRTGTTV